MDCKKEIILKKVAFIKELIVNNDFEDALDKLTNLVNGCDELQSLSKEITLFHSNYNKVKIEERKGIGDSKDINRWLVRILDLLEDIEGFDKKTLIAERKTKNKKLSISFIGILFSVILSVIFIGEIIIGNKQQSVNQTEEGIGNTEEEVIPKKDNYSPPQNIDNKDDDKDDNTIKDDKRKDGIGYLTIQGLITDNIKVVQEINDERDTTLYKTSFLYNGISNERECKVRLVTKKLEIIQISTMTKII